MGAPLPGPRRTTAPIGWGSGVRANLAAGAFLPSRVGPHPADSEASGTRDRRTADPVAADVRLVRARRVGLRGGGLDWGTGRSEGAPSAPRSPRPVPQKLPPSRMLDVEAQEPPKGKWATPPFDPRFPNQNQTRNCYQNFLGETCSARLWGAQGVTREGREGHSHP